MGKDRFIFRYTGDSENAEQEFSMLKSKKEVKVIDESPRMILGEARSVRRLRYRESAIPGKDLSSAPLNGSLN